MLVSVQGFIVVVNVNLRKIFHLFLNVYTTPYVRSFSMYLKHRLFVNCNQICRKYFKVLRIVVYVYIQMLRIFFFVLREYVYSSIALRFDL